MARLPYTPRQDYWDSVARIHDHIVDERMLKQALNELDPFVFATPVHQRKSITSVHFSELLRDWSIFHA